MPTNLQAVHIVAPTGSRFGYQERLLYLDDLAHFGGHEFGSAAERTCGTAMPHFLLTQIIISDLDVTVQCQENIIQLQISAPSASNRDPWSVT